MRINPQQRRTAAPSNEISATWEKVKVASVVLSSLAVPIILAVLGNTWTNANKKDELGVRYVELAVQILKSEPTDKTRSMRLWAISVVNHFSPVPLPASAQQELQFEILQENTRLQALQLQMYGLAMQNAQGQAQQDQLKAAARARAASTPSSSKNER